MEVPGLWRHAVKSLQGERLESARLEDDGLAGDRRWGIRDVRAGRILTARRRPGLPGAAASCDGELPVITVPGGRTAVGPGQGTGGLLSRWPGSPVWLVASAGNAGGRAGYFADATGDNGQAIEWTMPAGRYVGSAAVLVLSTASLRTAAGLHPGGVWDPRRFRPSVLIDAGGEGWPEDGWAGRTLTAGAVVLVPLQPCIRCTMVTRAQPGLEADAGVFGTLARHHRGLFGVWCDVLAGGTVSAGDEAIVGARRPAGGAAHRQRPCHPKYRSADGRAVTRSCRAEIRRATALPGQVAKAQAPFLAVTGCGLTGCARRLIAERDRHSYRGARE